MHTLALFTVDEILLPKYVDWFTNFRGVSFDDETTPSCLKQINSFRDQCLLLPITGYAMDIQLELVYLQEALDNLRSLHQ